MDKAIVVVWARTAGGPADAAPEREGEITVVRGELSACEARGGSSRLLGPDRAAFTVGEAGALAVRVSGASLGRGAGATRVKLRQGERGLGFFLRDVSAIHPILLPSRGIAVTDGDDPRSYEEIRARVASGGGLTELARIAAEDEESWEKAAAATRALHCETWLGLGRDMRIFSVDFRRESSPQECWDWAQPRFHGTKVGLPETEGRPVRYNWMLGRGASCVQRVARRLDEGGLPVLHALIQDGEVDYETTTFVTLERSPLVTASVRGTHYLVADSFGLGANLTDAQRAEREARLPAETERDEETVLCVRALIRNNAAVPRYAWIKAPIPTAEGKPVAYQFEPRAGSFRYPSGRAYCVCLLDREPLPQEEMALLVPPGRTIRLDMLFPHRPLADDRARALARTDVDARLEECRAFWRRKIASAATIELPERRATEMLRAGLLHCDLVSYGLEPSGTVTPTIGHYSALGTESWPMVQFYDSMGWHDLARRCLQYFLDKQRPDGFMQNFGGYMSETGPVLWTLGEHYRYTRDDAWVRRVAPNAIRGCEYLLRWRKDNMTAELEGKGYGLIAGKTADPNDVTRAFLLSGWSYLAFARTAEMLRATDPAEAERWRLEAEALKQDIRDAWRYAESEGVAVPLGDGTWRIAVAPWPESPGPVCLYAEDGKWYTHFNATTRDSSLSTVAFCEVFDAREEAVTSMLEWSSELFFVRNVRLSQPYISRHPALHLRRQEVRPFLKAWYNGFAGLADRDTYTFWEHYHHASPHKTEEEASFLMETRWMLYREEGSALVLLGGVPRAWFAAGASLRVANAASYFGHLDFEARLDPASGVMRASVSCPTSRGLERVTLRLPHPQGKRAVAASAGAAYDPVAEAVTIEPFAGSATVELRFQP
jgi:hypothetical protein